MAPLVVVGSYPSAEVQSAYSTVPANRADELFKKVFFLNHESVASTMVEYLF